jgi:hypothetical protein
VHFESSDYNQQLTNKLSVHINLPKGPHEIDTYLQREKSIISTSIFQVRNVVIISVGRVYDTP